MEKKYIQVEIEKEADKDYYSASDIDTIKQDLEEKLGPNWKIVYVSVQ